MPLGAAAPAALLLHLRAHTLFQFLLLSLGQLLKLARQFILLLALEPTLVDRKGLALKSVDLVLLHLGALFVTAMVCHGELARTRPPTKYLTGFYLLMSLGGVLGGIFNTIVAPQLFDRIWEYPLMMAVACLLLPRFMRGG